MESKFELATTRNFNGLMLNCYRENGQDDLSGEFWMTREQIGQLLGYKKPRKAIKDIHQRNQERLDKFSKTVELRKYFNGAQNEPPFRNAPIATVYSFKGLLEICRYSTQPNAHKVIDVLWDIADEIRRTGMYLTTQAMKRLESRVTDMERRLDDDRPFTNLGHVVMSLSGSIPMQAAAQFLAQYGFETGLVRLFRRCREEKLLCSRKGKQYNQPMQRAIERGLFSLEICGGFRPTVMVTPRGLMFLTELYAKEDYPLLLMMEDTIDE